MKTASLNIILCTILGCLAPSAALTQEPAFGFRLYGVKTHEGTTTTYVVLGADPRATNCTDSVLWEEPYLPPFAPGEDLRWYSPDTVPESCYPASGLRHDYRPIYATPADTFILAVHVDDASLDTVVLSWPDLRVYYQGPVTLSYRWRDQNMQIHPVTIDMIATRTYTILPGRFPSNINSSMILTASKLPANAPRYAFTIHGVRRATADSAYSYVVFGNDSSATSCTDTSLGEEQNLTPIPAGFDLRWVSPDTLSLACYPTNGMRHDYRGANVALADSFVLSVFVNNEATDTTYLYWPDVSQAYPGVVSISYSWYDQNTFQHHPVFVDMKAQNNLLLLPGQYPEGHHILIVARHFGMVAGTVFHDANNNKLLDAGEYGLPGWKVFMKNSLGDVTDSAVSRFDGGYSFKIPFSGSYTLAERLDTGWIQTSPAGAGTRSFSIAPGELLLGMDFGNIHGYVYTGSSGGNWSDSSNWAGGHVPDSTTPAIIPPHDTVIVDVLPTDSIPALKVESGGDLVFSPQAGPLNVGGQVYIENGGNITLPTDTGQHGIICYDDWINFGTLDPGNSIVTFAGSGEKIITGGSENNTFYQLEIDGDSTFLQGGLSVENELILHDTLFLGAGDSVIITTGDVNAIRDTAPILGGTVKRTIIQGELGAYRFGDPTSLVGFDGTGSYPATLAVTTQPNTLPPSGNFEWEVVGGIPDTTNNFVRADSVQNFSRWVLGIPKTTAPDGIPVVKREYKITPQGGSGFSATVQLSYASPEVPGGTVESDLRLLRGPFFADSVFSGWNLFSLPVLAEHTALDSLLPSAVSEAFSYSGAYTVQSHLQTGTGYWIRFAGNERPSILGDILENKIIPLAEGWNMIGTLSFPVNVTSVITFPPGLLASHFFGYRNGYLVADSLLPMRGYWVNARSAGQLVLASGAGMRKMQPLHSLLATFSSISIRGSDGAIQELYFTDASNIKPDQFRMPPALPQGYFDARFADGNMVEVAGKDASRDVQIVLRSPSYPVTISWNLKTPSLVSSLAVDGQVTVMKGESALCLSQPASKIMLRFGPASHPLLPDRFALEQSYPNPFNPSTTIRYTVAARARVRLVVYTILGQSVATLVDRVEEAGYRSVTWNASDHPSGVYYYRIEMTPASATGSAFVQVMKMLLVK